MTQTITAGDAWRALGADPRYEPSRPERAANGPMLWKLNLQDMLTITPAPCSTDDASDCPCTRGIANSD